MALKFNTFRANRYLRSKFVEGKFLLASEATDLELEILDLLREQVRNMFGDVALQDAWKVERQSATQILIKPGEAWFKGLPFSLRGGKDQLVSGAVLSIGTVPVGVTVSDDSTGAGKLLTFGTVGSPNGGNVTPTNIYRIVVTAKEELITEVQDEFLQNANLTESTAQKVRLVFQLNIVPDAIQDESPIPYRDENSVATDAGLTPTNFPNTGSDNQPNFVNQIVVSPAVGSGDLVSLNAISGAEGIDGRDLELILNNPVGVNPMPDAPTAQAAFSNGKFLDSNGTEYHINFVTNDTVAGRVKIVIDKEYQQEDPVIDGAGGRPYTLIKRDVYVTDDVNGVPTGKVNMAVATIDWDTNNGFEHESSITDLLTRVESLKNYTVTVNTKMNLKATDGGTIDYDNATSFLTWSGDIALINPHGPEMTITADSLPIVDGGSLVYDLDLATGGALEKGTVALNVTSAGATSTLDPVVLETVRVGNIVVDSGGVVAEITAINDVSNTITTIPALANTGAAVVYLDSFGPGTAPLDSVKFCLASRKGTKVYVAGLELEDGESGQIGDGASQELLAFVGSTGDADDSPNYTSEVYVTDGDSLVTAISALDAGLDTLAAAVTAISWKAPVADFASLPAVGNVDGDVRLVLDTRVAYHWDNANTEWLPLTGTGSGLKVIGGGTVDWALGSGGVDTSSAQAGNLAFAFTPAPAAQNGQTFTTTAGGTLVSIDLDLAYAVSPVTGDIVVDIYNAPGGTPTGAAIATSDDFDISVLGASYATHSITFTGGPSLAAATSYAFIIRNGTSAPSGSIDVSRNTAGSYPGGNLYAYDGVTFTPVPAHDVTPFAINVGANSELSFSSDMYLEKVGLAYTDNTIPTSESPIVLNADKDVAYVEPNLLSGGGNLSVTVDTLDNVPLTAVVIARRDGNDVIVGSSSTRLKDGQSTELYAQSSNQTLSYMGATDTADSTPAYSSDIRGTAAEDLTARAGALTDAMGDAQEDRSMYLRSNNPVTWTGTELQFTTDIVLEVVNTKSGTPKTATIQLAASPISLLDGESAWVAIDRSLASEILTVNFSGTTPIPAQSQANKDVIVIARRQDVTGVGYLHLPLHKQVLEPGQTVRLGASGAGGGAGNPILETLKNRLLQSPFEAVTPVVFAQDKDTKLDGASTGEFSLVTQNFEFDVVAETMVSVQMLDADFLASDNILKTVEVMAFWDLDNVDTIATYEVSRNGGNEWQTITMDRIDTTDTFRGIHTFDTEAANQTIDSQATSDSNEELNATTQKYLSQAITIANLTEVRELDLDLTINDGGGLAGKLYVALYTDNAGDPDELITETNSIDVTTLITGTNTIDIAPTVLAAGTYHIVLRTDGEYSFNFVTGVDSVEVDTNSAGTAGRISSDGVTWAAGSGFDFVYEVRGIEYDLRLRITAGTATTNLEGFGIFYDKLSGESQQVSGSLNREVRRFKAVADNLNEFTLGFLPDPDLLKVYYVESAQVFKHGAFTLSGSTITFEVDQFNNGGVEADVTLVFEQVEGNTIDTSDANALLLAGNFLGSADPSIDRSQNGRGIFLRRPDGTLREITIDDNDDIVIYSV